MESTVRELLRAAQLDPKAKVDAGRVDTVFQVGDQVMLRTKKLLDVADIGKLRPWWGGPFEVTAKPSPNLNAYTLALPARMLCSRTINVYRLKAYHRGTRGSLWGRASQPPGPVDDAGQEGEFEVEQFLNRQTSRRVTRYLVRYTWHVGRR